MSTPVFVKEHVPDGQDQHDAAAADEEEVPHVDPESSTVMPVDGGGDIIIIQEVSVDVKGWFLNDCLAGT
jgi:hypothetical protein